jgi:hypothetical protein
VDALLLCEVPDVDALGAELVFFLLCSLADLEDAEVRSTSAEAEAGMLETSGISGSSIASP